MLSAKLIACLGETGPVLMYTNNQEQVTKELIELLPDLAVSLEKIINSICGLHPVAKNNYYFVDMLGSWSIKAVLPTINPEMDYAKLEGMAERACGSFDTKAIVQIVRIVTAAERSA